MRALSFLLLAIPASAELTQCQKCCAPGGDCSKAFKGTPGKCCGTADGQSFCCPGLGFGGGADAKCYDCGKSYRCYSGAPSGNICPGQAQAQAQAMAQQGFRRYGSRYSYESRVSSGGFGTGAVVILMGIAVVIGVLCARGTSSSHHNGAAVSYGGAPVQGYAAGPMAPAYGYGGYGGSGAATGFLGGMLVGQALGGHSDVHHYHDSGGFDGGGGGFGGGFDGGGGGGDSGFAADS
jgi:hypothetical protein